MLGLNGWLLLVGLLLAAAVLGMTVSWWLGVAGAFAAFLAFALWPVDRSAR